MGDETSGHAADTSFMRRRVSMRPGQTLCLALGSVAVALSSSGAPLNDPQLLIRQAKTAVADAIAGPQFDDAAYSLEQYRTLSGSYQGAAVVGRQITVRWATDKMYCIEGVSESGGAQYLLGPNGRVGSGTCPYVAF